MSESYREQHPSLYEDLSEEEQFSPRYQKRFKPMVFRGRVRNKVKGAAAIIRLWPEHWSSSVAYWWMGIGMIVLTTFVVYNIVASVALLPPSPYKEMHMRSLNDAVTPTIDSTQLSFNVYMHLFVENGQDVDYNSYLPYIDIIANKYSDFIYHLIVVLNDTSSDLSTLSAEANNGNALSSLWVRNSVHRSPKNNVNIEHVTLSKYMEKSPLRQHWKQLPKQFIEFLTRAVSIWDKGGIAFNPTILTPRSPHAIYIEKIQNILKTFHHISKKASKGRKVSKNHHTSLKKRVNNIRDIIDDLEHDESEILPPQDLEVKKSANVDSKRLHESVHSDNETNDHHQKLHSKFVSAVKNKTSTDNIKVPDLQETLVMAESKHTNYSFQAPGIINNTTFGILPMFLEFLFRNKADLSTPTSVTADDPSTLTRKRKHVLQTDSRNGNKSFDHEKSSDRVNRDIEKVKPVVISAKPIYTDNESVIETSRDKANNINQLTIDLKGNIVASEVPCHALLGTIFSNAVHSNPQASLTDFIIAELSIFCKGVLSSCNGIDVILL